MRRLELLPCPESWEGMREDGDGRFCERCQLRVTEVAKLDAEGVDAMLANGGRICARFELDGGRPKTKLGLAAGLVVVALAGCANPELGAQQSTLDDTAYREFVGSGLDDNDQGGTIAGVVRHPSGVPLPGALVVLQSVSLEATQERMTNENGLYKFTNLPPGNYTIQVLYDRADISKITTLPENARFRANFSIDPEHDQRVLLGAVVERSMLDTTSASSTYSSTLIEYE